jgi:hypothetical protein
MELMPCFAEHRAAKEGLLVGRLLTGYGELEICILNCFVATQYQIDGPIRDLFSERGELNRLRTARELLSEDYQNASLGTEISDALEDMDYCRTIRNQYAHCAWYWESEDGLCLVNLEELAREPVLIHRATVNRKPITIALLLEQEAFFGYVKSILMHLENAYKAWDRNKASPNRAPYTSPRPIRPERPPLYA